MTTKVFIALEKPGHQPIEIVVEGRHANGSWSLVRSIEIGAGECHTEYVHSTQQLVINEVAS